MAYDGLLPFAALGQTEDAVETLREAVRAIEQIPDADKQHEAMAAAYLLSGLQLSAEVISTIIRRDVMQESVTYQAILDEGRQKGLDEGRQRGFDLGRQESRQEIALNLLGKGLAIELISETTGLSIETLRTLQTGLS
jgi:predicted transposase/invertase (TIGR01784 family)